MAGRLGDITERVAMQFLSVIQLDYERYNRRR